MKITARALGTHLTAALIGIHVYNAAIGLASGVNVQSIQRENAAIANDITAMSAARDGKPAPVGTAAFYPAAYSLRAPGVTDENAERFDDRAAAERWDDLAKGVGSPLAAALILTRERSIVSSPDYPYMMLGLLSHAATLQARRQSSCAVAQVLPAALNPQNIAGL